ncbi:MAG: septum formation initiator family protein [Verrucomicrobia bacterium]|nr:MAG: septum formation initiator family protein [Verrucomicrobiota bacterium]
MTLRRTIIAFFALLFVALTMFAGLFFVRTSAEYRALRLQEAEQRLRLAELEARLAAHQRDLEGMRSNPAHVERVIRERLGYARPDELVFRFEH